MQLSSKRLFKIMIAVEAHALLFDLGSLHGWLQKITCFTGTPKAAWLLGSCCPTRDCARFTEGGVYKDKMQCGPGQAQSHFTKLLAVY